MKGIVLAGGSGTRLFPITKGVSKQLLPIFDKPMVYYPLSVLMMAGIREILVITTPEDAPSFRRLLGDGKDFGLLLSYAVQAHPNGLAEAFIIGRDFVENDSVCLVLGDNIFYGAGLEKWLRKARKAAEEEELATVFGYRVSDPSRYGVAEIDPTSGKVLSIEEKPTRPKSNFAVTGLYFYPPAVLDIARSIQPSKRGELEITSVNATFLERGELRLEVFPPGYAWLDTGTYDSLSEASTFVEVIQKRQGVKIACLEEIGFQKGWLSFEQLLAVASSMSANEYGKYLEKVARVSDRLLEGKD